VGQLLWILQSKNMKTIKS